ncbi:MAG TPA: hypothetical protein VGC22_14245 [Chitinophaga sp.]
MQGPIGIFDSGYGGLTVLKEIVAALPQYDYLYLGDNARAPYGNRGFEVIHEYTLECVQQLFSMGCPLVILACNTASAWSAPPRRCQVLLGRSARPSHLWSWWPRPGSGSGDV